MKNEQNIKPDDATLWTEMKQHFTNAYTRFQNWMLPSKSHPLILQILLFIIKLPVLLLVLLLSPVVIVIMLFVFLAAI